MYRLLKHQRQITDEHITYSGHRINYSLRRSTRRRTISLMIDGQGLRVLAPWRAKSSSVEAMLYQHGDWILNKLASWEKNQKTTETKITHGIQLPILGKEYTIHLLNALNSEEPSSSWSEQALTLTLLSSEKENIDDVISARDLLEKVLRERLNTYAQEKILHFATQLDVDKPLFKLSAARTRWGSCSSTGTVRLNWRLVHFPIAIVDYVIAHEMAHLKEMNHSPRFWAVVESIYPGWQSARKQLKILATHQPKY